MDRKRSIENILNDFGTPGIDDFRWNWDRQGDFEKYWVEHMPTRDRFPFFTEGIILYGGTPHEVIISAFSENQMAPDAWNDMVEQFRKWADVKINGKTKHKTGYHVWIYGRKYWHRTLEGAIRRAREESYHLQDAQIIEVATGNRVRW